jgi:hypothetical protein
VCCVMSSYFSLYGGLLVRLPGEFLYVLRCGLWMYLSYPGRSLVAQNASRYLNEETSSFTGTCPSVSPHLKPYRRKQPTILATRIHCLSAFETPPTARSKVCQNRSMRAQ